VCLPKKSLPAGRPLGSVAAQELSIWERARQPDASVGRRAFFSMVRGLAGWVKPKKWGKRPVELKLGRFFGVSARLLLFRGSLADPVDKSVEFTSPSWPSSSHQQTGHKSIAPGWFRVREPQQGQRNRITPAPGLFIVDVKNPTCAISQWTANSGQRLPVSARNPG
jgi:hypothetical protein